MIGLLGVKIGIGRSAARAHVTLAHGGKARFFGKGGEHLMVFRQVIEGPDLIVEQGLGVAQPVLVGIHVARGVIAAFKGLRNHGAEAAAENQSELVHWFEGVFRAQIRVGFRNVLIQLRTHISGLFLELRFQASVVKHAVVIVFFMRKKAITSGKGDLVGGVESIVKRQLAAGGKLVIRLVRRIPPGHGHVGVAF